MTLSFEFNLTDLGRVSLGILAQQRRAERECAAKRFFSMKKKDLET